VTMVMARSYVWAVPLAGNPGRGADSIVIPVQCVSPVGGIWRGPNS
jgi:hypothetical protein